MLDGANITDDKRELALTVCSDLNFDIMKSIFERIFLKSSLNPNDKKLFILKDIKILNIQNIIANSDKSTNQIQMIKMEKNSRCIICDSKLPWVNKCPHKNDQIVIFSRTVLTILQKAIFFEEVNIVLITEDLSKSEMSKVFKNRPSKIF